MLEERLDGAGGAPRRGPLADRHELEEVLDPGPSALPDTLAAGRLAQRVAEGQARRVLA